MEPPTPVAGAGLVTLVGAGPGDPGLLTGLGREALEQAEVVVYDHLASERLLLLAPSTALRVAAGKSVGHRTMTQEAIHETLAEHARAGRRVVRLKGGDPYVFGRGGEEVEYLRARGIAVRVVPGVTAGLGATSYAGIGVTHRAVASAVAFVTGHDDPQNVGRLDWPALARFPGTLVIYMGVTRLRRICATLIDGGMDPSTPAATVESGTLPRQRTVAATLADLADRAEAEGVGLPALLVVGAVVARRDRLDWRADLPMIGQRIVVTRPAESASESARLLESRGAEALIVPTVLIRPIEDFSAVDDALDRLASFDWVVFTSGNGVRHFLDRLLARGGDMRRLGPCRLAAIGPSTAEALAAYHLRADLVPDQYRSEALADALRDRVRGGRVLLPRANRGRPILGDDLKQVAEVEQVAVYRNEDAEGIPPAILARIEEGSVDWIALTSPAIAARLHALISASARERVGRSIRLATISPVTSEAVGRMGWSVAAEAGEATWPGVVTAIERVLGETNPTG